jgi:WD40-like Beta Propeller Repeat
VRRIRALCIAAVVAIGCAAGVPDGKEASSAPKRELMASRTRAPAVELFFKGDQPWARRGTEEWSLGDVHKDEMVFSPDGKRFAYVRQREQASAGRGTPASAHVLVRNLAGDPVNDFTAYRPGMPEKLSWLDNRRLGYLAPPDVVRKTPATFVIHDADTGEVLAARSGSDFVWDPARRHVAFLTGKPGQQALVVDGKNVWPRAGLTKLHGDPVWSADGHGLAIVDEGTAGTPRLVVMVEFADPQGDLTWPVPREALAPGLRVFWAGDSKVVIGESAFKPKFAAGWERLQ